MGRKAVPQPLMLSDTTSTSASASASASATATDTENTGLSPVDTASSQGESPAVSPAESRSPRSPRASPLTSRFAPKRPQTARPAERPSDHDSSQIPARRPLDDSSSPYPPISSVLNSPAAPNRDHEPPLVPQSKQQSNTTTSSRKPSKGGFFHFTKSSRANNQFHAPAQSQQQNHIEARNQTSSRGNQAAVTLAQGDASRSSHSLPKPVSSQPSRSDVSSAGDNDSAAAQQSQQQQAANKKGKPGPFGLLTHTKSLRDKESANSREPATPVSQSAASIDTHGAASPIRTAPAVQDRSFREMVNSAVRNRSEDRNPTQGRASSRENYKERETKPQPLAHRENGGSNFLSGLKYSSTKATSMFSKGFFGKGTRSASTTEREGPVDDEHYVLKVINLPLLEQTRKTRISKRLENSRDKTEFWMPAFPWRAIDYLNYKGCDVEGLYRVPGSGPQIKKWQRKFDEQYDVNLFDEEDLYDINIIGSMLKAWLRELPDELFPKAAQERISRECAGAEEVPQMLIDELSNLPPFNYYLLFAITCHLSLLLAHTEKNKMDFRNLCICFQPCMKIDAFCFKFLVCDWKDCWKGCNTEAKYVEEEYKLFDQPPPQSLQGTQPPTLDKPSETEQQPSSSASSYKSTYTSGQTAAKSEKTEKAKPAPLKTSNSKASLGSSSSISSVITSGSEPENNNRTVGDMRPLSPIKPLSPLGFN